MEESKRKLEFIDFVLSIADEDLPFDKSIQFDIIQYRLDEIEEQLDCIDDRLDIFEKKLNSLIQLLTDR